MSTLIKERRPIFVPNEYSSSIISGSVEVSGSVLVRQGLTGSIKNTAANNLFIISDGNVVTNYNSFGQWEISGSVRNFFTELSSNYIYVTSSVALTHISASQGTEITGSFTQGKSGTLVINGADSHAQGSNTTAKGDYSHAEGYYTIASGSYSHTEGQYTTGSGGYSHAEGNTTNASGAGAHAEGSYTNATGGGSHAEGYTTTAQGFHSHAEGIYSVARSDYSHAEGRQTNSQGGFSHTEGYITTTTNIAQYAHAEGYYTIAQNLYSHVEGYNVTSSGVASHAEGHTTQAKGDYSHSEGYLSIASGSYSHAQGYNCVAYGTASYAGGYGTIASGSVGGTMSVAQTVFGSFNKQGNTTSLFVIGSGSSDSDRGDIFHVNPQTIVLSGGIVHKTTLQNTAYTILPTDRFVFISVKGADRTVTLPASSTVQIGHTVTIRKVDNAALNKLTISASAVTEYISGKDGVQVNSVQMGKLFPSGSVTLVYGGTTFNSNFDSDFSNNPTWFITEYSSNTW